MADTTSTSDATPVMLTVRTTAARLSLSLTSTYQLIREGKLPHYRIGGAIRIAAADIDTFLAACRQVPATEHARPSQTRLRHIKIAR